MEHGRASSTACWLTTRKDASAVADDCNAKFGNGKTGIGLAAGICCPFREALIQLTGWGEGNHSPVGLGQRMVPAWMLSSPWSRQITDQEEWAVGSKFEGFAESALRRWFERKTLAFSCS
jgi:hypothetical protein